MKNIVLIVAAGRGKRMNLDYNKQLIPIRNKPLVLHTIDNFAEHDLIDQIVLIIHPEEESTFRELIEPYEGKKKITLVTGGQQRYDSVYRGLQYLKQRYSAKACKTINVLIHDGARPLIQSQQITEICNYLAIPQNKACILGTPVKDSYKIGNQNMDIVESIDRSRLFIAQTPQAFRLDELYEAYGQAMKNPSGITDDATVMERYGKQAIKIIMGDYYNIKVTTIEDVLLVEKYIDLLKK